MITGPVPNLTEKSLCDFFYIHHGQSKENLAGLKNT